MRSSRRTEADDVARHEWPGPEMRQHVRGPAPEYGGDVDATVDGQIGARTPWRTRADRKDLAGA